MSNSSAAEYGKLASAADLPSPVTGWRRFAADMAAVGGSTIVCQGLGVVQSLLLRFALTPAQMGVWQGLKLLLGYANYANLGVSKGAARELTIAAGSGQTAQAERGLNLAFTVNTLSSLLYGACLAAAAVWLGRQGLFGDVWPSGLLALAALVAVQRHLTFQVTILRCRQAFAITSWISIVEGSLSLALAGTGAWQWGLPGLYAGTLLSLLGTLLFLRRQGVPSPVCDWQWSEIKRLVAIGGPILLGGAAANLFQSLDRLMILSFSPEREFDLGCYSMTLLITGQISGLANMFAMVAAPRYGELFGRTGSPRDVARLAARASELLAAATSLSAAVALVLVVPILGRLFPDYRPGLQPAAWLVPGILLLALSLPLNHYLVAIRRERSALAAALVALAAAAVGDYAAFALGHGISGVAASTAAVYAAYYGSMLMLSLWPRLDAAARRRYLLTHAGLLVAPVVPALLLTKADFGVFDATYVGASLLLVLASWGAAVVIAFRRGDWRLALRS